MTTNKLIVDIDTQLEWNTYKYFPYEKVFAFREIDRLLNPSKIVFSEDKVQVMGKFTEADLKRLVYFGRYRINGKEFSTLQAELERSCSISGSKKRQSTRYSVNGMHEYKGKFNPQIVRGILNILGVPINATIFDPFAGSGTTLVESTHLGMNATGCDMNPLAVYISNAKLKALATPSSTIHEAFNKLIGKFKRNFELSSFPSVIIDDIRTEYLSKWFDDYHFRIIEFLKFEILKIDPDLKEIFLVLASDLLRDYSLQEPSDLRIRRRFSPYPQTSFYESFQHKIKQFLENLSEVQKVVGVKNKTSQCHLLDTRTLDTSSELIIPLGGYDASITSPPYATALPYIDTQRLSLVWLNLITPQDISNLEAKLTGSREFFKEQKKNWGELLEKNGYHLPHEIHNYCLDLEKTISSEDGFRKRLVPSLIYRYLSDMKSVFSSVLEVMRPSAPFALVVGHNRTKLGGVSFDIDTPSLLKEIAKEAGWIHQESIELQTYKRYGINSINAINNETLLILRKP